MASEEPSSHADTQNQEPLFSIGQFSTLSMLSIRMLRYYDAHGLLTPTEVDAVTGYQFYRAGLLRRATVIRSLRDVGCSVGAIATMLPHLDNAASLETALAAQRGQLLLAQQQLATQLANLDRLALTLKEDYMITVERITIPSHTIVALRGVIPSYPDEGQLWGRYMSLIGPLNVQPTACGASFYDEGYKESDVDVEVCLPVRVAG